MRHVHFFDSGAVMVTTLIWDSSAGIGAFAPVMIGAADGAAVGAIIGESRIKEFVGSAGTLLLKVICGCAFASTS
jgi:hypothetical protein